MPLDDNILGQGVYTPREAARLVGTNAQQILRWTRGSGPNEPLWTAHFQFLDNNVTEISFLDLIEVRVVSAMRKSGISLQAIRFAMDFAQDMLGVERPLASQEFKTDGKEVLMTAIEKDGEFVSLSKKRPGQKVFKQIVMQSLNDLEYEGTYAARWRPQNYEAIILDPSRHFGNPILDKFGISTQIVYNEFKEFNDLNYLATIYEVPTEVINDAIQYERGLDEAYGQSTT